VGSGEGHDAVFVGRLDELDLTVLINVVDVALSTIDVALDLDGDSDFAGWSNFVTINIGQNDVVDVRLLTIESFDFFVRLSSLDEDFASFKFTSDGDVTVG